MINIINKFKVIDVDDTLTDETETPIFHAKDKAIELKSFTSSVSSTNDSIISSSSVSASSVRSKSRITNILSSFTKNSMKPIVKSSENNEAVLQHKIGGKVIIGVIFSGYLTLVASHKRIFVVLSNDNIAYFNDKSIFEANPKNSVKTISFNDKTVSVLAELSSSSNDKNSQGEGVLMTLTWSNDETDSGESGLRCDTQHEAVIWLDAFRKAGLPVRITNTTTHSI